MPSLHPPARPYPCGCLGGAGLRSERESRRELRDAHNIFCAFVCDACEADKRAQFDPRIFTADPYPADEPLTED